jgi:hypothetical protein
MASEIWKDRPQAIFPKAHLKRTDPPITVRYTGWLGP